MHTLRAFTLIETLLMIAALVLFTLTSAAVVRKDFGPAKLMATKLAAGSVPASNITNRPTLAHLANVAVADTPATSAKAGSAAPPATR